MVATNVNKIKKSLTTVDTFFTFIHSGRFSWLLYLNVKDTNLAEESFDIVSLLTAHPRFVVVCCQHHGASKAGGRYSGRKSYSARCVVRLILSQLKITVQISSATRDMNFFSRILLNIINTILLQKPQIWCGGAYLR